MSGSCSAGLHSPQIEFLQTCQTCILSLAQDLVRQPLSAWTFGLLLGMGTVRFERPGIT